MLTFTDLYRRVVKDEVKGVKYSGDDIEYDKTQLECLNNPEKYPLVWRTGQCECSGDERQCAAACIFNAITHDEDGNIIIDNSACVGCEACIDACKAEKLIGSKDTVALLKAMNSGEQKHFYALVAPAISGQFGADATMGKLRTAFKQLGFTGMVEVALFADILTLKEALEFDAKIKNDKDFLLTSCCCPVWISMIRKVYGQLVPHIPPSVSPMIACGRSIKQLYPDAVTVFIGPCLAKKAEAREKDIADAVDFVLTFEEIGDIFDAAGIEVDSLEEDLREHSSSSGRGYAHTGGVSKAVSDTVNRLRPDRSIKLVSRKADGVKDCRLMLSEILEGKISANFIEGMGCNGGCVGGPKIVVDKDKGRQYVEQYSKDAEYPTAIDNPYVIDVLGRLGIPAVETLLEKTKIFSRDLSVK